VALYKSKGIVLRSIRYGEADRILDLYTQDVGLVSMIAKGIRRTQSRFGGRLEPLSCVEFLAYEGRTLDTITQVEVLRSFRGVREDLVRLEVAGSIISAVRALSGSGEADRRIFNLLYHALDTLEGRDPNLKSVEAAFSAKLSVLAGYALRLHACVSCDRNLDDARGDRCSYFAPPLGGVLCADCRQAASDSFPLPPGVLGALQNLIAHPMREATVEEGLQESVRRVVSSHVLAHAPGFASLTAPNQDTLRPA